MPRGWSARPATWWRARRSSRSSEGRGTPNGGVWIDVSHLGAEVVERNFRGMVRRCRDFGRDLARGPVEVGPTTHFMMGGVVDRHRVRHRDRGALRGGRGHGRRPRRQPPGRQRRRRVDRVRRHRRRRHGGFRRRARDPACRRRECGRRRRADHGAAGATGRRPLRATTRAARGHVGACRARARRRGAQGCRGDGRAPRRRALPHRRARRTGVQPGVAGLDQSRRARRRSPA